MEKWLAITIILMLLACNPIHDKVNNKNNQAADSLFHLATSLITTNAQEPKDDPRALMYLNKAIKLNPNESNYHLNRGAAKINLLLFEEAISDFKFVLEKDASNVNALINIAMCYNHIGAYDQAIVYSSKAINLNDNMGYAYYVRSDSYLYKNDYDNLCKDLDASFKRNYTPAANRISNYCNKKIKHLTF